MKRIISIVLVLVVGLAMSGLAQAATITVGPGADYDSGTIQAGIDAAVNGDIVLVAPGEYIITEPITFLGKAITVKSEAGPDETTIRMGTPEDTKRGSVVVFESNETADSVLEGFTITGGTGSWFPSDSVNAGGAIVFNASSGTLRNCAIVRNRAGHSGAGVLVIYGSSAHLTDCNISQNSSEDNGGGMSCVYDSSATMNNCVVVENSVGMGGGGLMCWNNSSLTMTNCEIMNNTARWGGGVMCDGDAASVTLNNCIISRNAAFGSGAGGLFCAYPSALITLRNCTVWGNSAAESGGVIVCWKGSAVFINSIFWKNDSPNGPEIVLAQGGTLSLTYCNVAGERSGASVPENCTLNWGGGNIDSDPLFVEPGYWADVNDPNIAAEPDDPNAVWVDGDYHLKSQAGRWDPNSQTWVQDDVTSPCIDAGDPNSDWMGETWPRGERINMGAYGGTREASMSTKPEAMSLPRVAYVYGSDVEATESFRSLLMSYGCPTTLLGVDDVAKAALDSYDLIIVANDTQHETTWSDPNIGAAIEDSGRPVVGLGYGGYDFFGLLGLSIGNPYGGHGSKHSIEVTDPNGSGLNTPYSIEIPQDHVLRLYTETNHVGIYLWPTIPETVTVLGREVDDVGYHPLVVEQDRYLLWGFTESPEQMTEVGKTLFINTVIHTANGIWGI